MDGRGAGSCIMLGSMTSGPSFSGSPFVKLSVAGCGGVGKGGSCVLIPDIVVMEKVGASGSGVSLLYRCSDRTLEGKDHCRCLLQTSIPTRTGCSAHIHQSHGILRSNRKSGCIASEMEEMLIDAEAELGELIKLPMVNSRYVAVKDLNQKPFLYSVAFPLREKWKNLNLDVSLVALSACIGSLALVLLEEDASSSKRFLLAIAIYSF
ncbi:hypothetical protein Tco_0092184 [Tanacetum coccineum]